MRQAPTPPRPDLVRRPQGGFGWLDDRLLREGWFARIGIEAVAVLALLALAADRRGASFYSRRRMAAALGVDVPVVDRALAKLRDLAIVELRPWRADSQDGVWQLLPLPQSNRERRRQRSEPVIMAALLRTLGYNAE